MRKFLKTSMILMSLTLLGACSSETVGLEPTLVEVETMAIMGNFPHYNSIEHLASTATEVVRVEFLDERVEAINIWLPPENKLEETGESVDEAYHVYTVYRVRVLEVFQGNVNVGDILEVKQLGGQLDDLIVMNYDIIPFESGDDLILFLQSFASDDMPASLLNAEQSAYRFTQSNENARNRNINDTLQSLNTQNDLTLTLNDLAVITENNSN